MSGKKRPGLHRGLPTGSPAKPLEWDLSNPYYESFAEKSMPGEGRKNFPAPSRYWKRFKFERKAMAIQEIEAKRKLLK